MGKATRCRQVEANHRQNEVDLKYYFERLLDERCSRITDQIELQKQLRQEQFELVDQKFDSRDKALMISQNDKLRDTERRLQLWIFGMGAIVVLIEAILRFAGHV